MTKRENETPTIDLQVFGGFSPDNAAWLAAQLERECTGAGLVRLNARLRKRNK
jgi:hypothetical protein